MGELTILDLKDTSEIAIWSTPKKPRICDRPTWKAFCLLWNILTPLQRETLSEHGFFNVDVEGRTFLVWALGNFNIYEQYSPYVRYCLVSSADVNWIDNLIMQKLYLTGNLEYFLSRANVWYLGSDDFNRCTSYYLSLNAAPQIRQLRKRLPVHLR